MKTLKTSKLSHEKSVEITSALLEAFKSFYPHLLPIRFASSSTNVFAEITSIKSSSDNLSEIKIMQMDLDYPEEKHHGNIYKIVWGNRYFQVAFYKQPQDCGYYSKSLSCCNTPYVICYIIEEKSKNQLKYFMCVAFNPDEMTFLELLDIEYHATGNHVRECRNIKLVEDELRKISLL